MRRTALTAAALTCVAAASFAATNVLKAPDPEVIEIEVSAGELNDCRETLAQVAQAPAVADNGSPLFFDRAQDLPSVRCVVSEA